MQGVDLSRLSVSERDLRPASPGRPGRWLSAIVFAGTIIALIVLPQTDWYKTYSSRPWVFFVIAAIATLTGISVGRWVTQWVESVAANRRALRRPKAPPTPPSKAMRALMLVAILLGGGFLAFGVPRLLSTSLQSDSWFWTALGAFAVAVLAIRWLLAQAQAHPARRQRPVTLPPWWKWVTLGALILIAAGTLIVGFIGAVDGFALGASGLLVGVLLSGWLARRVEEVESRRRRRRS